jgi:RNA polymerase I-specific transcription initiation factor RRN6
LKTQDPRFKQIGSSAELYPPSKKGLPPQTHAKLSAERNLQRRWLLKSHPEAFMGNEVLSELLTDDLRRFPDADEPSATQALLAIGEISDFSIPSKPRATRILAVATGNSGESLRLAHVEDSEWIWDEDTDSVLHLSVLDSVDNFEEAIWSSDGLPISQIKFVSDNSTSDPIRWLLVQKQTSTVILSPRYDKHPRTRGRSKQQTVSPTELSRINPNPLVTLRHQETGGNAHIDVAFNAPADGRPPQLCVMDECGYWTLWNVIGKAGWGSGSWRLSLCKCGHIFEGSLQGIPSTSLYPATRHGAFFVGTSQAGGEEDPFSGFESQEGSLRRSAHLLAWNAERIEIMDVRTDALLAKLDIITTEVKHGRILDVQASPVSQNHIFVLTTRYVIWVDVFFTSPGSESGFQPLALLTCPHLAVSHEGLKLSVGPVSDNDAVTSMLFVYATKEAQASIFWFRLEEHGLPEWHRQIAPLLPSRKSNEPPVQLITFQPVRLECSEDAEGIGAKYQEEGGQFYQGMILDDNLGLKYCMGYSSKNPVVSASLPTTRLGWTKPDQHRKWRRKRERILRHMGSHFVVPDHMLHLDRQLVPWAPPNYDETRPDELGSDPHRNAVVSGSLRFNVEQLAGVLRESMYSSTSQRFTGISVALVDTIQGLIQHGHMAGTLPLRTWYEVSHSP